MILYLSLLLLLVGYCHSESAKGKDLFLLLQTLQNHCI